MNKREKILVTLTIAVAIGAGLFLLLDKQSSEQSQQSTQKQDSLSQETMKQLDELDLEPAEIESSEYELREHMRHVIQSVSRPWPGKTFYQQQTASDRKTPDTGLHYSGYMQTNGQYLAIINGLPFARGERLNGTGWDKYKVQSITPDEVVIRTPQGSQKTLTLHSEDPLEFHSPDSKPGKQD
ncbi:MAG: hypothetical protein ACLFT5_06125 [Desulfovermiculus sp.]